MKKRIAVWKRQQSADRHSNRLSEFAQKFQFEIVRYLEELKAAGTIVDFVHHQSHGSESLGGKDFTVTFRQADRIEEKSFGVTISHAVMKENSLRYPKVPTFHFPIGTNKDTIIKRILTLIPKETEPSPV